MSSPTVLLRRTFVDVCRGYSVGHTSQGGTVYIRHLGHFEHASYEEIEEGYRLEAIAKGAQTETSRLEQLYAKGLWSPEREAAPEKQRDFIARMEEGRKTIAVPSILKSHEEHIARERAKLNGMLTERAQLVRETAETHAQQRLEDYYLVSNLFVDSSLTTPVFTPNQFDDLDDAEMADIHKIYKVSTDLCSDGNLRRLAAQDFFMSYWILAQDDAQAFYGRAVCELTYYQIRLAGQARYIKSLIETVDLSKLPPDQRNNPDAIERLHITQKNTASMQAKGETPVGLSSTDMKEMGMQGGYSPLPPPNLSGIELVKWMKKNNAGR